MSQKRETRPGRGRALECVLLASLNDPDHKTTRLETQAKQRWAERRGGRGASGPRVLVRPFGGQFSATVLRGCDGAEHRLQIFPDPHAATRCAALLGQGLFSINSSFKSVRGNVGDREQP